MRRVIRRAPARADLKSIHRFIASDSRSAARAYLSGLEKLFAKLAANPQIGMRRLTRHRDIRVFVFKNHLVFYRPLDNGVEILRVLHGAQDWSGIRFRDD